MTEQWLPSASDQEDTQHEDQEDPYAASAGYVRGAGYRITKVEKKTADEFLAEYKGRSINICREDDGRFYIIVTHLESGMHDYDGWMEDSSWSTTIEQAIDDALKGAMLVST